MGSELLILLVVAVVVGGLVLWLRKAAETSRRQSGAELADRVLSPTQRRSPKLPRPEPEPKHEPAPTAKSKSAIEAAEEDTDEADEEFGDGEDGARAAAGSGAPDTGTNALAPTDGDADVNDALAAREGYRTGLAKTRGGFVARLGKLFAKKQIDDQTLEELEEVLFTADIGPRAADKMFREVKAALSRSDLEDSRKVWHELKRVAEEIIHLDAPPLDLTAHKPLVLLTIGVNGAGKTTTIGKLAHSLKRQGKSVLLAAGDTFRAAATEQLVEWAKRADVPIVTGKSGGDPSSVIFDAVKRGVAENADIIICDTAGRLHSNTSLMEELKKIRRVCDKALPGAPHETWLVLDATTGQNAIAQAKTFKADMEITGIVLTKLDGTAKGGVILGICDELAVPVRYVGVGEKAEDLRPFDPHAFVDALFDESPAGA